MNKLWYIVRRVLVALLLLLFALASAKAQTVVYVGDTSTLEVEQQPGDTYGWELYDDGTVDFAQVPGNCPASSAIFVGGSSGASVQVTWLKKGFYFFKVTAYDITGCTMNLKIGIIEVREQLPKATITPNPDAICIGDIAKLEISFTGNSPRNFTITDGINNWVITNISENPYQFYFKPVAGAYYWVSEVSNTAGTNTDPSPKEWLEVKPKPTSSKIYQYEP